MDGSMNFDDGADIPSAEGSFPPPQIGGGAGGVFGASAEGSFHPPQIGGGAEGLGGVFGASAAGNFPPQIGGGFGAIAASTLPSSNAGKRSRHSRIQDEAALDDIIGQITSKVANLTTKEDERKEEIIRTFVEILGATSDNAAFYLESANWDIETAATLFIENNLSTSNYRDSSLDRHVDYHSNEAVNLQQRNWKEQDITIIGLGEQCPEWSAKVSGRDGKVYFVHIPTLHEQREVPPGFCEYSPHEKAETTFEASSENFFPTSGSRDISTEESSGMDSTENSKLAGEVEMEKDTT